MGLLIRYVNKDIVGGADNGESEANAWTYLYQATGAMKTDAGTNNYTIYAKKAGTAYGVDESAGTSLEADDVDHDGAGEGGAGLGAVIYLDQAGSTTAPNKFEGYHTTPGDGGVVTLDCQGATNQLLNVIRFDTGGAIWTTFKNFDCQNSSGAGGEGGTTTDNFTFKNCRFKNIGAEGAKGDNASNFQCCMFDNVTGRGIDVDNFLTMIACIFKNGSAEAFYGEAAPTAYNCLSYDNGNLEHFHGNGGTLNVLGCTIDGNENGGQNTSRCVRQDSTASFINVVNTVINDAAIGILADRDHGDLNISRNNSFFANTDESSNFITEYDGGDGVPDTGNGVGNLAHITGDPVLTNYEPGSNIQAKALDAKHTIDFWASFDDSDNPPEPENE